MEAEIYIKGEGERIKRGRGGGGLLLDCILLLEGRMMKDK